MNLLVHLHRKYSEFVATSFVETHNRRVGPNLWGGILFHPDDKPQLRIKGASNLYPFRERAQTIGWRAKSDADGSFMYLSFEDPKTGETQGKVRVSATANSFDLVKMPWQVDAFPAPTGADLVFHVPRKSKSPIFLATFCPLEKDKIISLCKGKGVEIGPGPNPRVLPGPDVEVHYLEQKPAEEWSRLYGAKKSSIEMDALFENYRLGDANNIPYEDGSLDFIFSSHVFEHLSNPLGHLEIWSRKLKKGGKIACIVPELAGASDYVADASKMELMIEEYNNRAFDPTYLQYSRWAKVHGLSERLDKLWNEKSSIHIHYYTNANMAVLLQEATKRFGLQGYSILHSPNNKDFQFVVMK